MEKLVLTLSFVILMVSCGRKLPNTSNRNTPMYLRIASLKTENISEEITANDEIHLMIWLVKDSISAPFILKEWEDSMVFSRINNLFPLKDTIRYLCKGLEPEKTRLAIVLMEVDTEQPFYNRASKVRKIMEAFNYQPHDSLKVQMAREILDDDLLGLSFYSLSELRLQTNSEILFSGSQLFDKFFYRLKYYWE